MKKFCSYLMILCGLLTAVPLQAQSKEVYEDQYVLRRYTSESKQTKLMSFVDDKASEDFVIAHSSRKAVLVRTDSTADTSLSEVVNASGERFCALLRRKLRQAKKQEVKFVPSRLVCTRNYKVSVDRVPNDSYYGIQYGLPSLNVPNAWDLSTGLERLSVVAVADTGIDLDHSDLKNQLWTNTGEIPGNGIDDDNNGYIDDIHGYDFVNNDGHPDDGHGHGTHVAGVIAAQSDNSLGVAGIDWSARLVAVKVLSDSGSGSLYGVLQGIAYINHLVERNNLPVRSSNYSLGGGPYISSFVSEITRAKNNNIMFVAAAGNASNNNDQSPAYPASYGVDNVISVAALDDNDNIASFSNYGLTKVHVGAPGVDIASCYHGNRYVYMSGTSMAAPHVAGVVSLAYSYSGAGYKAIKDTMFATGAAVSALSGKTVTGTKPDMYKLLVSLGSDAEPNPSPSPSPSPSPGSSPVPNYSVNLYEAKVNGPMLTVDYLKDFDTCIDIYHWSNSSWKKNIRQDFLCQKDQRTKITVNMSEALDYHLKVGDVVKLCHSSLGLSACSESKTVVGSGGGGSPEPSPTPQPSPFPIELKITTVDRFSEAALPGTELQLLDTNDNLKLLAKATTDGTGFATFNNLKGPINITLKAVRNGYLSTTVNNSNLIWTSPTDSSSKEFTAKLIPLVHKVKGLVVDESNKPLVGAIVKFNVNDVYTGSNTLVSNSEGRFEINLYHDTVYRINSTKSDYALDYEVKGVVLGSHERLLVMKFKQ